MRLDLEDGKYTYVYNNGEQYALRYGEPRRDLVGDNLIYAMAVEIEDLRNQIEYMNDRAIE